MAAASPSKSGGSARGGAGTSPGGPASSSGFFRVDLIDVLPFVLPYLAIRDASTMKGTSRTVGLAANSHTKESVSLTKATLTCSGGPTTRLFNTYGAGLLSLTLHRVAFAAKDAFPSVLAQCPNLRSLAVTDCDWALWDAPSAAAAIAASGHLQELRLQCTDVAAGGAAGGPFGATVQCALASLRGLHKLSLFTRLEADATEALVAFLARADASPRLHKVKFSTSVLAGPAGAEIIKALGAHASLQKVTIVRPEGVGEPLRKAQCALLAAAVHANRSIIALHLRRCGLWTDTLQALAPAGVCAHLLRLKLDSNSLGYLSGTFFNDAMDTLLSRFPSLQALHIGNNQLDAKQAEGLAASIARHRLDKLENLTMGSNDIGDVGLSAILKSLPRGMKQLYLHGIDCSDAGVVALKEAILRMPDLWGLGLNGNPISDVGATTLAEGIVGKTSLRDIGITLSEMTDVGCGRIATALQSCLRLRYVYLYTTGFKASTRVTDEAKKAFKEILPTHATGAFDHRLSRYLKKP